ncbi:ABC transporter permease [Aquimonas voraii]|uniref:Duplicated orphan permease n=1 Tax=Aquimonas voraii TaxID=265719 RepID=A0A1G6W1W8_9GAMM|nr:ABC transporter permease [Aquimonas voraii]SDD59056.1 duplicated orphan permease [Aquimonas voraii]
MSRLAKMGYELAGVLRGLVRAPGFSLVAVWMLGTGIGLSVAMFSALQGMLLSSLPLREGASVVVLQAHNRAQGIDSAPFTAEEAEALSAGVPGFERIAYYWWYSVGVFDGEAARDLTTHMVGPGYFDALGVEPVLGRLPSDEDIRQDRPVALLSYAEWQRRFGGSTEALGQRLDVIDEAPLEVIGVLPADIGVFAGDTALWRPLSPRFLPEGEPRRNVRALMLLGRLLGSTTTQQADAALAARMAALARSAHETEWSASTRSLLDQLVGDLRGALWGAFALALLVLLIGASNLALMLDARRSARLREHAVRLALGASPSQLWRAGLIELVTLSTAAVAVGVLLAAAVIGLLRSVAEASLARSEQIQLDSGALLFATVLGLLLPGLVVMAGAVRGRALEAGAVRGAGRGLLAPAGAQRWLPTVAVALATVSLVSALGLANGLWRLQRIEPGYQTERVHVLQIFRVGQEAFVPFAERMLEALAAVPGVEQVALSSAVPLSNIGSAQAELRPAGRSDAAALQAGVRRVSAGYRNLLDIPLLGGRDFSPEDRRGSAPVILLSATAARRLFATENAVGRQVELPDGQGGWLRHEVVGVVADIRNEGVRNAPAPEVLVPFAQSPRMGMSFLVRSRSGGSEIDAQVRAALQALDPRQPVTDQFLLQERLADQLQPARVFSATVGLFAVLALLLAAAGVYAVASLQQRRRLPEYGLRLAVGARPAQLAGRALGEGLVICLVGVLVGAVASTLGFHLAELDALGIQAGLPLDALAVGAVLMVLVALAASAAPALRAARTPPTEVLRHV